jgi:hypothetical protein
MARVKGPLMSLDARGEFALGLRFRGGARGVHAYIGGDPHSKTKARVSPAQANQRNRYRAAVAQWRELTALQKREWSETAKVAGLTGFAAFLSFVMGGGDPGASVPLYPAEGLFVALEAGALADYPASLEVVW